MHAVMNTDDGIRVVGADEPTGVGVRLSVASAGICGTDVSLVAAGITGFILSISTAGTLVKRDHPIARPRLLLPA